MPDGATHSDRERGKRPRDQSTIKFPYGDLEDAVAVANALMKNGGVPCDADQLAAALDQAPTSGNFRLKIATARIFGILTTVAGRYQLSDLGFAIVDKTRSGSARADAFLHVPLYRRVYDEFRNRQLPPRPAALERALEGFGVAPKQKERARQALDRSAQQAGFFAHGNRDRLIRPTATDAFATPPQKTDEHDDRRDADNSRDHSGGGGNGNGGDGSDTAKPLEYLLIDLLKRKKIGDEERRAIWTLVQFLSENGIDDEESA